VQKNNTLERQIDQKERSQERKEQEEQGSNRSELEVVQTLKQAQKGGSKYESQKTATKTRGA
jgi:hypothetical protein